MITFHGKTSDFYVALNGEKVADVWHSDKGEWTVATVDGPVYREKNREAACTRCVTLARQTLYRPGSLGPESIGVDVSGVTA